MTKSQLWTEVQTTIAGYEFEGSEDLVAELAKFLAPKKAAGSEHPPVLDDKGKITEAWCRYHQTYEPAGDMVISGNKSKGYCKAAASVSNARRKSVQSKQLEALKIMGDDIVRAQELVVEAEAIEPTVNGYEFYDLKADWAEFNSTTAK